MTVHMSLESCPALVLNADFRPLSNYPLSLWSWQNAIKAIYLDRDNIVSNFDRTIKSPSFEMQLSSVVSFKDYIRPTRHPAFTRFKVFLRDRFRGPCSKRGRTTWDKLYVAKNISFLAGRAISANIRRIWAYCSDQKGGLRHIQRAPKFFRWSLEK